MNNEIVQEDLATAVYCELCNKYYIYPPHT